jgi:predicted lipoprotein with Yx(FWY)xxD motif
MTVSRTRSVSWAVATATLAVLAAGCGSSSSGNGGQAVTPAGGGSPKASAALTTQMTSLGTVVADSKGNTVYELVGDTASNSKCNTSCQAIWPPVMSGGSIKLLHGHPLFTFSGDSAAGQTHGQGVKDTWGLWLALNSQGKTIPAAASKPSGSTSSAPTSTSSSSSGGGGYGY